MANDITKYVTIDNIVYLLKKLKQSGFFVASDKYIGGIKLGYEKTGTRRPVQLDESHKAYVELWTDENQTGTVGKSNQPIYFDKGEPNPIVIKSGDSNTENPLLVNAANDPNGIWDTGGRDKGDNTTVKGKQITANFNKGTLTAPGGFRGKLINDDYSNVNVGQDVQDDVQLVYFKDGKPTAPTKQAGKGAASDTGAQAIFVQEGHLKPISTTVGSATKPIYMEKGVFTVGTSTVGSATKPIYLKNGELTVGTSTVGSTTKPVYLKDGELTACNDIVYTTGIVDKDGNPQNDLAAVANFGGLPQGTTMEDLNTKSFSEILDILLFPDDNNITILNSGIDGFSLTSSANAYAAETAVTTVNNAGTFNRGTWDKYNGDEAALGTATNWQYSVSGPTGFTTITGDKKSTAAEAKTSFNGKISSSTKYTKPGTYTFKAQVWYGDSNYTPKNNKGVSLDGTKGYPNKKPAANNTTRTIKVYISLPWFATTSSISTLTQQSWRSWQSTIAAEFTVVSQGLDQPTNMRQRFELPAQASSILAYDTSTDTWKDDSSKWEKTQTTRTVGGTSFTYYLYVNKATSTYGQQKLQIKF